MENWLKGCVLLGVLVAVTTAAPPAKASPQNKADNVAAAPVQVKDTQSKAAKLSDAYKISVHVTSGASTPQFTVNAADLLPKDQAILRNVANHDAHHVHGDPINQLPSGLGYLGLIIEHVVNDKVMHEFVIPKCELESLQWRLINMAAPGVIRDVRKNLIRETLIGCLRKNKTKKQVNHTH